MKHICSSFPQLTIFFLVWQLISVPAHAQWSTDPNINNTICTAVNEQSAPAIVSDGAGGAIIAWQDSRGGSSAVSKK